MGTRSPVLGYNHNVRYAGRLWHVQTEDSGVSNPHIFTHLFNDGTILSTKRLDYDPGSDVGVVQKLMQSQHKAMLRELKGGTLDEKIGKFFGAPVVVSAEERGGDEEGRPTQFREEEKTERTGPTEIPKPPPPPAPPASISQMRTASTTPLTPAPTPASSTATPAVTSPSATGSRPASPPAPPRPPLPRPGSTTSVPRAQQSGAYATNKPTAEGVIVGRPVVVGGAKSTGGPSVPARAPVRQPPRVAAPVSSTQVPAAPPANRPPAADNIFGADLISEKSLDEVILAYLSEDVSDK